MTIDQIKQGNKQAGNHFFEPAAMNFFNSRILQRVIPNKTKDKFYFVTSEKFNRNSPRLYTIRIFTKDGNIDMIGEFQEYKYSYQAYKAIMLEMEVAE
jgi:hypothetical protein